MLIQDVRSSPCPLSGTSQCDLGATATATVTATTTSAPMDSAITLPSYTTSTTTIPLNAVGSNVSAGSGDGLASKRGISYNVDDLVQPFSGNISWKYNWGTNGESSANIEYVPMLWGLTSQFPESLQNSKAVLSFNEPDNVNQSNIDPISAAKHHRAAFLDWKGKVQIGSPAITNGPAPMGIDWLTRFFQACGAGCPLSLVAFHWYGSGPNAIGDLRAHVQAVIELAAQFGVLEVWLTEFGLDQGTQGEQANFMTEAVKFLDSTPSVGRYAAFMASDGTLLDGGTLNVVGEAYIA